MKMDLFNKTMWIKLTIYENIFDSYFIQHTKKIE